MTWLFWEPGSHREALLQSLQRAEQQSPTLKLKGTVPSPATRSFVPGIPGRRRGFLPRQRRGSAGFSGCLAHRSKVRTKTDPPGKGHGGSPRAQKRFQPPASKAWQGCPNLAESCQVPHSSHRLLQPMTSAQANSTVLWLGWTCRDLSPGHAGLLLFPRKREGFCLFPC